MVDLQSGDQVVVVQRRTMAPGAKLPYDDQRLIVKAVILGTARPSSVGHTAYAGKSIIYHRCAGGSARRGSRQYRGTARPTSVGHTAYSGKGFIYHRYAGGSAR